MRKRLLGLFYGAAGYAPRIIHGSEHTDVFQVVGSDPRLTNYVEFDFPGLWDTTHGIVAAAGMERRIGPLRIAPEVRYVFWKKPAVEEYGSRGFTILSSQHQVDVMVEISWGR